MKNINYKCKMTTNAPFGSPSAEGGGDAVPDDEPNRRAMRCDDRFVVQAP